MNVEATQTEQKPNKGARRSDSCVKHGTFDAVYGYPQLSFRNGWSGCEGCLADYSAAVDEAHKRRSKWNQGLRCLINSGVPKRHRRKSFKNFTPQTDDQRAALRACELYVQNFPEHRRFGRCLSFIGPPGVGKSHLSCAVLSALAELGHSVQYTTASDLIYAIRNSWHGSSEQSAEAVRSDFCECTLLLIDDVGCLAAEQEHIRHIIERRYNSQLPTMITTNLGTEDLASYIDVRGLDRLRENGGLMFALSGSSHRATTENTVIDEPLWWEKYMQRSANSEMERQEEEEKTFSVRIQDFPGLWTESTESVRSEVLQ